MKRLLWILGVGILIVCYSCYDDKGSYDYHAINEISVSGWKEGGYNAIFKSDTLKIVLRSGEDDQSGEGPILSFTEDDGNAGRYEYEWEAKLSGPAYGNVRGTIIGTERNLNYFVTLAPGSYYIYLRIRDKENGLVWSSWVSLVVRNVTDKGFLVFGEKENGEADLDMISFAKDTIVLKELLAENGLPALKKPLRVMYTGSGEENSYVWISTEEGGYYLDPETFAGEPDRILNTMVFSDYKMPEMLIPMDMNARKFFTSLNSERVILCKDYVFPAMILLGEFYGNPVNRMSASSDEFFKPFPFIFCNAYYPNCWILYNETDHRFVSFGSTFSAVNCSKLQDAADDAFPWIQPEGRECVYGENTMNTDGGADYGNSMALMSDNNGFYVYKFYCYYRSYYKMGGYTIDMTKATGLNKGLLYSFATQRSLLLYAEGNILHAYDYQNQRHYSLDMENEITYIGFDFFGDNYDELVVATYNQQEKGILNRYVLGANPNTFELKPIPGWSWKGLVKVKDVEYKE